MNSIITMNEADWSENDQKYLKFVEDCLDGLLPVRVEEGRRVVGDFCKVSTGTNIFVIVVGNISYNFMRDSYGLIATHQADELINQHLRWDLIEDKIENLFRLQEL